MRNNVMFLYLMLCYLPLSGQVAVSTTAIIGTGATLAPKPPSYLFTQVGTTPVLTKGSVYNGWTTDALAAPAVTNLVASGSYAGLYVMTVSFWSVSNAQWSSGCFTSPDLSTWTYVANSLQSPTGGDYIVGNSGIVASGSTFIWAYTHYASGATNHHITIATSTDLVNWTVVNSSPTGSLIDGDPSLDFDPSGTLELWSDDLTTTPATAKLYTSGDSGTTWTSQGSKYTLPANVGGFNTGEPSVYYVGGARYLIYDIGGNPQGGRFTNIVNSPQKNLNWTSPATANTPNVSLAWQSKQVFDATVVVADTGDGRGSIPRMLYAGSDTLQNTDNTNSSIGLAYLQMFK